MRPFVNIVLFALIFSSCSEDGQLERHFQEGTYTGTFHRNSVWVESDTAMITMTFEDNL